MTSIAINRQGISRTLSTRLAAPNDLDAFAKGLSDTYMPKNHHDYSTYRRYMHDILCLALIEIGLYKEEELMLWKLGLKTNDKRLNQQKPDLYSLELTNIEVGEVLLSYNAEQDKSIKMSRYRDLFDYISSQKGLQINFNVIAVDLSNPEWDLDIPRLPEIHMKMLSGFIDNLRYIHSNSTFSSHRKDDSTFYGLDKFRFELSPDDIPGYLSEMVSGPVTLQDIYDRIEGRGPENYEDDEYIALLARGLLSGPMHKRPSPHPEPSDCKSLKTAWAEYTSKKKNTDKVPRILQLGCPLEFREVTQSFETLVKKLKESNRVGGYFDLVKSFLSGAEPEEGHIIRLSLSDSQLEKEQMEGPGRKSLLRRKGIVSERKAPTHIGIYPEHVQLLDDLVQQVEDATVANHLQEVTLPDLDATGPVMYAALDKIFDTHLNSPFSGVSKFYQRISQEIIINSMRRRKNRQYVLCDSGFDGIFCLIAPGAQLRTESNTEFVKIISFLRPVTHSLSAPWHPTGDHWESDWLSVDTDRLKHWARSFDRTLLSNVACAERLVEPGVSLTQACINEVKSGNYQLMVLTYLEDKQLTSLTNQTLRYLWMKALGDKQFTGIMSKFPTRVGSVIQSVMLQRSIQSTITVCERPLSEFISVSKARQDDQTGAYDETTTGVVGRLPRLFTKGEMVPIAYNLNEIYWCMMYNKDRQNPAQDALSILSKVLKEEEKFNEEIARRETSSDKLGYLFGTSRVQDDLKHIWSKSPESHYFSRRAVQVGMRLQSTHEDNVAPDNSWMSDSKLNAILSKNLSEFATFKASVKTICRHVNRSDLDEINLIGKRTKAVELVAEIVSNEKLLTSFEVAMSFSGDANKLFDVMIQIFKKGQIGGVREIMILFIKARILFNIVEEISRLLSKSDKREILTKGKDKRLMMRGDFEEVLSLFPKGSPVQMVKNSYDMTTWAQKFIPTIFCTIYTDMLKDHPHLKNLAYFVFLKHTNKMIEYPKKLVELWCKNPDVKHDERWMQQAKEDFLKTGIPFFRNHSNMCQGIPHYNSTVLALSCQSLRDALFKECLSQLNQECHIRWKTRVGSDDKGDMIGIDMSHKDAYPQYLLFEQCAHASERLHSMELSVKSAAGNIIYELNSAFMANLETLSPTIKFALASCDMIQTSSCTTFVNESYGRIRQLRENGGSSVLCGLAHTLNSEHFKTMFRIGRGMTNDVEKIFSVSSRNIPYDFGVYPFYDVDLQDLIGPEYHNYICLTDEATPRSLKQLLFTPLSKEDISEEFPSLEGDELLKKDHFGIRQGLIKQLVAMRRRLSIDAVEVDTFFSENPFLLIRGPETIQETIKVIHSKLLTKGASEALRRTSPAIYLGRLSAFESAKAWKLRKPNGTNAVDLEEGTVVELEDDVSATYSEFLTWGLKKAKALDFPIESMMNVIFPQKNSYEVVKQFVGQFGLKRESLKKYSQAVRTWVVNNYNYNFNNSLKTILETSFGLSQLSSREDVNEFRKLLSFELSSYDGFLEECRRKHVRPMDLFFYMSKIYKAAKSTRVQTFAFGPSTNSLHNTLISIKRFSHIPNVEMKMDLGLTEDLRVQESRQDFKIETLKFCCNLLMMENQGTLSGPGGILSTLHVGGVNLQEWCETTIRGIRSLGGFDHHTKKVLTFIATAVLNKEELKEKLLSWNTLNFTYLKRQKKVLGQGGSVAWEGDLKMLVNAGRNTFTLNVVDGFHFLACKRVDDLQTLLSSLHELCRLLGLDTRAFFTRKAITPGCLILTENGKSLLESSSRGPHYNCLNILQSPKFFHLRLQDFDSFTVETTADPKSGSITVSLNQRGVRSAVICHFPGSYYPASSPKGLVVPDSYWFRGIKLSRLLQNSDWFYNYRLPSLTERETTSFFKNDVNLDLVLQETTNTKGRIVEYLQVMDEINEEAFSINNNMVPTSGTNVVISDFDDLEGQNVEDLFKAEMEKIEAVGPLTFEPIGAMEGVSWSDMVEEELEISEDAMKGSDLFLNEQTEDGIRFIRSMGYKRKARKANYQVISQMQLGHLLKERILNMFFKNGSVASEERRLLPHYYIWVREHSESLGSTLSDELKRLVLEELCIVMGATKAELRRTLDHSSPRLETAPTRLMNFLYGEDRDLFSQLSQQMGFTHERYEESEGSEFE